MKDENDFSQDTVYENDNFEITSHHVMPTSNSSTTSWIMAGEHRRQPRTRKGYGRRFSFSGGRKDATKATNATSSSLFGRAKYGSSPSFDSNEGEVWNNYLDGNADSLLERNRHCGKCNTNTHNNYEDEGLGSEIRSPRSMDSLDEERTVEKPGKPVVVESKAKKKRPNLPRPPSSSSAVAAALSASSRTVEKKENTSSLARRSIFTPKTSAEFSSERLSERLHERHLLESPPSIGTRGDIKRSKVMLRRSHSVTAVSSQQLLEENVHPNDCNNTTSVMKSSCIEKKTTDAPPCTRSRRQANSKKRTATSGTEEDVEGRNGLDGFHHELKPSPPKIAARSSSIASFTSTSFSSSASSVGAHPAGGNGESFSSLAKRGSSHCWANNGGGGGSCLGSRAAHQQHHIRSCSSSSFPNKSHLNGALKTPSIESSSSPFHHRSYSQPVGVDLSDLKSVGSSSFLSPGALSTPSVQSTSSRKRGMLTSASLIENEELEGDEASRPSSGSISGGAHSSCSGRGSLGSRSRSRIFSPPLMAHAIDEIAPLSGIRMSDNGNEPMSIFSPPMGGSLNEEICLTFDNDDILDGIRKDGGRSNTESDNESMSSDSDESSNSSSSEEEYCPTEETAKELSDAEIFESKSSYDDFKFLTKSLLKWSQTSNMKSASMGLNNGCLVAVPPNWTFEHRAKFVKWAAMVFRFRVGSVGGAGGSFLRCSDSEGKEALKKLQRILNDYKAGKLAEVPKSNNEKPIVLGSGPENIMPKSKIGVKLSATRRSSFSLTMPPTLPVTPFCDEFVADDLAKEIKSITIDEKEPEKNIANSVPRFIRSISLQPLTTKIKNSSLHCFRSSPTVKTGIKINRLPRLSAENAINGSDFINHLHGSIASPIAHPFPRRLRERANRMLLPCRPSFENPVEGQQPYESPHPRCRSLAQQTPSRLDFGLET